MIISASRRTDIPAYYDRWFFGRLREGFVYVRNPVNPRQVSKVALSPETVDGIVFWTKNPAPMLDKLHRLKEYPFYFQFTLTGYGPDVEPNLPDKDSVLVPVFQRLSGQIGPDRVIWRYDPIFIGGRYTADYHIRRFEELAKRLSPYTGRCTISFLDFYRNTAKRMAPLGPVECRPAQQRQLAARIGEIARGCGLQVDTCAEGIDLQQYGIGHGRCIDGRLLERLAGRPLGLKRDPHQREHCGCAESVDIGAYHTCPGGCRYCYANAGEAAVLRNHGSHDPAGPLLAGRVGPEDRVTERKMPVRPAGQLRFD